MVKMVRIDTKYAVLKDHSHFDTWLKYMCAGAGVKDVLFTIFHKTGKKGRRDFRTNTTSLGLNKNPLTKLLEESNINNTKSKFLANLITSSFEYFNASDNVNLLVKPVLIFYAMEHLAAAAVYSRYKVENNKPQHGLSQDRKNDCLYIKDDGLFSLFFYSHNAELSLSSSEVNYKILLKAYYEYSAEENQVMKRLAEKAYKDNDALVQQYSETRVTELVLHYILMFYFCNLSRYQINYWEEKLSQQNQESFLIRNFLEQSRKNFPIYLAYQCFQD